MPRGLPGAMTSPWWAVSLLLVVAFSGCLFGDDAGDDGDDGAPTTGTTVSPSVSASASPTATATTSPSASPSPTANPTNGTNSTNTTSPSPSPSPTPLRLPVTWDVEVRDNSFAPTQVTLQRGDAIRWTHNGFADHALVGTDDPDWQSHKDCPAGDCFDRSEKFTHTFRELGTHVVYCRLHGGTSTGQGMAMTVVVKERHDATP